jgi:hypothetical protein
MNSKEATKGWFLPYGCGIDRADLEQEVSLALVEKAEILKDKPESYSKVTVRNALGMLLERERAKKRYPKDGFQRFKKIDIVYTNDGARRTRISSHPEIRKVWLDIPSADRNVEGEVYVSEILDALPEKARDVIKCRMNPAFEMLDFYRGEDRPIPAIASYADVAKHLGVSIASVIKAINEARRVIESD